MPGPVFDYLPTGGDTVHIRNLHKILIICMQQDAVEVDIYQFFLHYTGEKHYHILPDIQVDPLHCHNAGKMMEFFLLSSHHLF